MAQSPSTAKVLTSALVVTGIQVGAGILALPINIGPAGLIPAIAGALAVWGVMTFNGLVLSRQPFLRENSDADLPTLFEALLGKGGKWVSVAANLIILYGLLVAYLAGVSSVVANSYHVDLPQWVLLLIYFCIATLLASLGDAVLRRGNAILMATMWLLFGALLVLVIPHFEGVNPRAADWRFFTSGLPILLVAFNFHNLIPTLCRTLNHDQKAISKAIWLGSGIGMFMTMLWTVAVILTLPMESANGVDIISAFKAGVPATVPLNNLIRSPLFVDASIAFSVVAMTTSYMGTGVSLTSFLRDVAGERVASPVFLWLLAFMPPLLVGVIYPDIFLKALNIVGGFGIGTLFGVLPGILLVRQPGAGPRTRLAGYGIIVFFLCILFVEFEQEAGLLRISPDVEYWSQHINISME